MGRSSVPNPGHRRSGAAGIRGKGVHRADVMRRAAVAAVIALGFALSCSCAAPADATKGRTVNSYEHKAAVTAVKLTAAGSVADALGGLVAAAPDGKRWALATLATVRLFDGDRETRAVQVANEATAMRRRDPGNVDRVTRWEATQNEAEAGGVLAAPVREEAVRAWYLRQGPGP